LVGETKFFLVYFIGGMWEMPFSCCWRRLIRLLSALPGRFLPRRRAGRAGSPVKVMIFPSIPMDSDFDSCQFSSIDIVLMLPAGSPGGC